MGSTLSGSEVLTMAEINCSTMAEIDCSDLNRLSFVGPFQVFSSIGHWNTAVYVILALHVAPFLAWTASVVIKVVNKIRLSKFTSIYWLILTPASVLILASLGIIIPSTGKLIEAGIDVVISIGFLQFINFTLDLCSEKELIIEYFKEKEVSLQIGAPPFICLTGCKNVGLSKKGLSFVIWGPRLLFSVKFLLLAVEVVYALLDYTPSGYFLDVDNFHNILNIPASLFGIYCLNIYMDVINVCLDGNSKRFLVVMLLVEFIIFDSLKLFFVFIKGTHMLACVPPFLSQDHIVYMLKNIIKGFLATFIGVPFLNVCREDIILPQLSKPNPSEGQQNYGFYFGEENGLPPESIISRQSVSA